MSTQSNTLAALDAEIQELEERLNLVQSARALLIEEEAEEATTKKSSKSSSTKSSRRQRVVKQDADDDTDESDEKPARRSRSTKSTNSKKGTGKSRKEVIVSLLEAGKTPREIADKLDMRPNYVYHVKRELEGTE